MFRQGIRRCGGLARTAASASMLLNSRSALPVVRQGIVQLSRPIAPLKTLEFIARSYSTEAAAINEETPAAAAPGEVTAFGDLGQLGVHRSLVDAITKGMRYEYMTPVQAKTINPALKGTDIVAQAKTGTGKTIAFLLPLLQRMIAEDPSLGTRKASRSARSDDIRGIVLSPTRELAEQIASEARRLTRNTGLIVQCAVGGTNKRQMLRQTQRQGCHLLVATPGRLNDLLQDRTSGIAAPNLAALVLDEADRMLDVGFEKELSDIQNCLPNPNEKVRQTILVSATIPNDVIRLARTMVRPNDFEFVQTIAENEALTHDRIPQHIVPLTSWANMFPTLFELIDREDAAAKNDGNRPPFKAIIYFNTTAMVQLAGELGFQRRKHDMMKIPSFAIHSQLSQMQRTKAADMFRNARSGILMSTDVTARGMDFPNVTHVIQADIPRDRESYIHRLGRTGRQNKGGEGWLLVPPTSMNSGRQMLRDLPIEPNKTLESPSVNLDDVEEMPEYHQDTRYLIGEVPDGMLGSAYTSLFGGQTAERVQLVDDLNHWAIKGWDWPEPPAVTMGWAKNQGLVRSALNIQNERRGDRWTGNKKKGRFNDQSEPRVERESSDPFDRIQRTRRDNPRPNSNSNWNRGRKSSW